MRFCGPCCIGSGDVLRPTVLFVDDNTSIIREVRIALRHAPFEVLAANSAGEAMAVLRRQRVDVVVSDEQLPGIGGAQFLAVVRAESPHSRRIIVTDPTSVETTIAAVNEAQVFRVVAKPYVPIDLLDQINAALAAGPDPDRRIPDGIDEEPDAQLLVDFEEALGGMYMAYQPIYSPDLDRVSAYEALMRLQHPVLATPIDLIEAATKLGRQAHLDHHVCNLVSDEIAAADHDARILVNLLPESLEDGSLLTEGSPLLAHADRVGLEVTERVPLDAHGSAGAKLNELREAGFCLVLDDLGAGYSGLNSFANVLPEVVKFDMELVSGIEQSETKTKLVSTLVMLCQDLGILTVAEGVETAAEYEHLLELGCDLFQGYFIARPAKPWTSLNAEFLELIGRSGRTGGQRKLSVVVDDGDNSGGSKLQSNRTA